MALLRLQNASLAFGDLPLLDEVNFSVEPNERICLIGRNGEGKSTLMKVIRGAINIDSGERILQKDTVITQLEQEVPRNIQGSIYNVVAAGLAEMGELLKEYHRISQSTEAMEDPAWLNQLEDVQHKLENCDGWNHKLHVDNVISRLELDPEMDFSTLSGGMKRRVLLARALVQSPDILLLDEPTNHLDIDSILWLENFLLNFKATLIFITHDRSFLRQLATRIVELDRGKLSSWPGDYDNFLRRKQEQLDAEETENALFDKKLAQEEKWIRQGIKARRTRNEGRVRALKAMREERSQRREQKGTANLNFQAGERSGKIVAETKHLGFTLDNGRILVKDLSVTIQRGDKVGFIGPNGVGKTTLINLLIGKTQPTSGTIKLGTNLEVAYFDQLRSQLDEERSVRDNLDRGADKVEVNGKPRHVISYLQDFLFTPKRINSPVSSLSGGEKNRLLLAKLFLKPANLLILDEPTNDLDVETLDLLEELLLNYTGTVLLVSHDRSFLNNIVTSSLVFEGKGEVNEYIGGYDDWLAQRKQPTTAEPVKSVNKTKPKTTNKTAAEKPKKLSYKDQRELDQLPALIEELETALETLQESFAQPDFYKQDAAEITKAQELFADTELKLETAYARWEELEG